MTEDLHQYLPSLIRFHYYENQKVLVHKSISTLFSLNHRVFSGGVYLYHSLVKTDSGFEIGDILNIGMTGNYADRFYAHNLGPVMAGNKRDHVNNYFSEDGACLGVMMFAFKHPMSAFPTEIPDDHFLFSEEDNNEPMLSQESDEQDIKFATYKTRFERSLASAYHHVKDKFPDWWNDPDKKGIRSDEGLLQSISFIKHLLGNDNYACDYSIESGFRLAKKVHETAFPPFPDFLKKR